jgi:hypothetical protein
MKKDKALKRLAYIRKEIEAERISTAEMAELQSLAKYIDKDDVLLLEWAGFCEFCRELDCNCAGLSE